MPSKVAVLMIRLRSVSPASLKGERASFTESLHAWATTGRVCARRSITHCGTRTESQSHDAREQARNVLGPTREHGTQAGFGHGGSRPS